MLRFHLKIRVNTECLPPTVLCLSNREINISPSLGEQFWNICISTEVVPHLNLMACLSWLLSFQLFHHLNLNKTQLAQPIKQYQSITGELKVGTTAEHPLPKLFFLTTLQRNYSENCSTSFLQPAVLTYPPLKSTQIRSELVLGSPSPPQLTPNPAILCHMIG